MNQSIDTKNKRVHGHKGRALTLANRGLKLGPSPLPSVSDDHFKCPLSALPSPLSVSNININ